MKLIFAIILLCSLLAAQEPHGYYLALPGPVSTGTVTIGEAHFYDHIPCKPGLPYTSIGGFRFTASCDQSIAKMHIVDGRWEITIQPGYSLLDLFRLLDETPKFPLAKSLVRAVERRGKFLETKLDPQVVYLEKE